MDASLGIVCTRRCSTFQMNTITCSAGVSARQKGSEWAQAQELLSTMASSSIHTAVSACKRGSEWAQALELLSAMAGSSSCRECLREGLKVGAGLGALGHDGQQ